MNQSKSDICTLTTFTAQNHVLKVALICIAALVNIYSRKRTDRGGGEGMEYDDDGRKKDSQRIITKFKFRIYTDFSVV